MEAERQSQRESTDLEKRGVDKLRAGVHSTWRKRETKEETTTMMRENLSEAHKNQKRV